MKETAIRLREFAEDWANTPIDTDVDIRRLNVSLFLDQLMRIIDDGYMSNELVNQEVEKRIAGVMPTDKEGQLASFNRYPQHGSDQTQQYKQAAFFLGWRMCLDELRSRLVSQKTEGGGE